MFAELLIVSMALSVLKGVSLLVSYINNNAFPQPLNEQEEARYLQILRVSKTEPFTLTREVEQARNTLVEHNLRLVAHLVKKFDGTGEDGDDLISIGTIGLIKGINTFDPGKGTKLATYAARCIENEIFMTKGVLLVRDQYRPPIKQKPVSNPEYPLVVGQKSVKESAKYSSSVLKGGEYFYCFK